MFKSIRWQKLSNELLSNYGIQTNILDSLGYYDIVHVLVDENEKFLKLYPENSKRGNYCIFTEENGCLRLRTSSDIKNIQTNFFNFDSDYSIEFKTKKVMLGHLIDSLKDFDMPQTIKVNPIWANKDDEKLLLSEEVLFAPIFDQVTKKYLISDPSDAIALLAVSPDEQKRFGIELTFYMITNKGLPEDQDRRAAELRSTIDGLSFMIPRIPQKKGSATFFVTIINLENPLEEMAFIRNYPMLDDYANCLFVTSDFKMRSGNLQEIHYDGEQIDTIFMPMIEWQKSIQI